jgi:outer membrane protein OmpA-like peptidoglycan-associated protein
MATDRRPEARLGFLASPYVVLVDLLIATFFVLVLYVHSVRWHTLAATDPRVARIQKFKTDLASDVRRYWGNQLKDEGEVTDPAYLAKFPTGSPDERWWKELPRETVMILKQDASSLKLILFGSTEARALFRYRSNQPTAYGMQQFQRLVRCLGESKAAHGLVNNRAILSVTIEGHTGDEGWRSSRDSWSVSLQRALRVEQILETLGKTYDDAYRSRNPGARQLFSPGRFSVVGRGHYTNLPFTQSRSPANRRVQIEIRFTQRYGEETE